jgi:hypothetical protein
LGQPDFGFSVALSSDGNTALIGGNNDEGSGAPCCTNVGAVWVFTRSGSTWTQQGPKLTANDESGGGQLGYDVALSSDGNTALAAGPVDNNYVGAAWVFTRTGSSWTQQGSKLTANDESGFGLFGGAAGGDGVALSADGNTALIGGDGDGNFTGCCGGPGAAWVFTRSGSTWSQQGPKLIPNDETGAGRFGGSVTLSGDGTIAVIGGPADNSGIGAAWTFTSNSVQTQLQNLLVAVTGVGPGTSLADKVSQIEAYVAANDMADACQALTAFINEVKAQTGKKITAVQAASFIAQATSIQSALGC